MRRRIASLLGNALLASVVAMAVPSPVSADTNVCAGQGTATTSPIFYPVSVVTSGTTVTVTVLASNTGTFSFTFGLGVCLPDLAKGLTATGSISGWCGHSAGVGVTGQGHRFNWISAGSFLVLTGEVTGLVNAIPNPTVANNSCLSGATAFLVTGAVVLYHCINKTKVLQSVPFPVPATHQLVLDIAHLTTQPATQSIHVRICT